ncbi:ubiquinol-cytochrome-c reductase complex assembly factor 3-like [Hypanus sabinus]|uniref:ubiquinol-cytochrome-c reductase complex assembly factor 3-like n=1 Tax=Hypanus sabinus TaxID=79690 RepID=UPI0028C4EBA2|nr:ubiquinol-cytochrome-c reductase complex assembly factor 3-like [Hypanus sabinus]XP_059815462.1 ubiquinol-cytochrome-c reductase complex assembly factor 3-like [Hypanus sabinus]
MSGRSLVMSAWALAALGAGGVCWLLVGPSEQRQRDIAQHLPEMNRAHGEDSRHRNAMVMEAIKKSAETQRNVALDTEWKKVFHSDPLPREPERGANDRK